MMTLVNKYVLSGFHFNMVFLVLAVQALGTIVLLVASGNFVSFIKYRKLNKGDVMIWLPVACSQAAMLYTGGKALQYLNIPLFTVFKNLTIIAIAYGEYYVFQAQVTPLMLTSFSLMVLSSLVGAWSDITFNMAGYIWMSLNCFASAVFVIHMRRTIKRVNFSDIETVYFNNLLTLPMYLVLSLGVDDWSKFISHYTEEANVPELKSYIWLNALSGFSAFAISYCSAWCIRKTSSTTYSMAGALNKLPIAMFSMMWLPDKVSLGGIMAVLLGFSAGLVYTHAKNVQKREQPKGQQVLPTSIPMDSMKSDSDGSSAAAQQDSRK
ncbi:GDP-mannose transporter into the lumen of the Golgi [Mycoemilia scoparia]|uniref:GDP-mannose transporter n=1 Tax=Mycoemilia scoparia TaxID=417184 RepID=A0A9W8A166_9FUNG|nr:GDP-mannose transporter into the lumen of the Golgi [Mycoemilia scoparia]